MTVFTLLYNNFNVIDYSLTKLRITSHLNLNIVALDNHFPNLTADAKKILCDKFDIELYDKGENLGLSGGYNFLISEKKSLSHAILYDCDSNPETNGWDNAIKTAFEDNRLAYTSLTFDVCEREFKERGFNEWQTISGINMVTPNQACVQSVGGVDLEYLRFIGGLQEPKKYYGGLEGKMFNYWNDNHRLGYLKDFREGKEGANKLVDNDYIQYKYKYAHQGYDGSYDDYLKNKLI